MAKIMRRYRYRRFLRVLRTPVRLLDVLLNLQKYKAEYEKNIEKFNVGDVVCSLRRKSEGKVKIFINPELDKHFSPNDLGKLRPDGALELLHKEPPKMTPEWSFFEAGDPWVIKEKKVFSFKWCMKFMILRDCFHSEYSLFLEPLDSSKIVWARDMGFGVNIIPCDPKVLEKFDS